MKSILNESQIEQIANTVGKSNIASVEMKDDFIDHLCCIVEDEMSKGKDFETVYQTIFAKRLNEIQNETVFLFTSKNRKRLDRFLYVSGFAMLTLISAYVVMKMLFVPGTAILFLATAFVVIFLFFPAVFVRLFTHTHGKKPVYYYFVFFGALLLTVSGIFYISHWPGMFLLALLAVTCANIALFPLFFVKIFKNKK